jgi:hypothetical protein
MMVGEQLREESGKRDGGPTATGKMRRIPAVSSVHAGGAHLQAYSKLF